ncbi:hypothetical protein OPQ81_001812 [Rhizoctonia solani]|nr:hypothetical protein OPQ81_001812 [Rhizoctonia solani]
MLAPHKIYLVPSGEDEIASPSFHSCGSQVVPGTESKGTPKERSYSGLARPANSAIDSQLRSEGLTRRAI